MPRVLRKLRHWRQRFDPDATFIFRRSLRFNGIDYQPGDLVPQDLLDNR